MFQRAARQFSILACAALSIYAGGNWGGGAAAATPTLNLQSGPSGVSCKAPDVVVYVDNYQNLKIYYTPDQAAFTAKPDQSAGTSVTGFACLSIAKANGFAQGLNVIPVKGPNGVTFNLYPTAADAKKPAPTGCRSASGQLAGDEVVYVNQGRAFKLDDPVASQGLSAFTCWSEAFKGGIHLDATFYKDPSSVKCAGSFNPVVYADNTPGHAEYYEPQQPGFKTKPDTGGYLCEVEAKELGYVQHHDSLPSAQTSANAVRCSPAADPVIYFDFTRMTYFPADRTVNWGGATSYGGFACLTDAKTHGFHLLTTTTAQGAGPLPLLPGGTADKDVHISCDTDAAWFMPATNPTKFVRESSANYAGGNGVFSCGRYGVPFLGAQPATPADAKIPPPFTCNQMTSPPADWVQISYAASTPYTCSYDLDKTTIDPSPSTACGAPPNAYTFTTGGRRDVMRVSLMQHAWFAFHRQGNPRIGSGALDILCQIGKATGR